MNKFVFKAALLCALVLPSSASADGVDNEANEQNTPEGWTAVQLPVLPEITSSNTFDITSYGASTSSNDNTTAIQKALNAVPSTGGKVVIPAGTWLCGPIHLKSKTILYLSAGATLKMLPYGQYPSTTTGGKEYDNFISNGSSSITDVVIEGEDKQTSVIDGQGEAWWIAYENDKDIKRGAMIRFKKGSRFLIKNLTVKNAPGVNITISQNGNASHATIHDVIIREPSSSATDVQKSHNTDGISMWGPYINIYNCDISNGDDNVVADTDARYVHVWNCKFGDGHGASIGSYTENLNNIIYEDCTFNGTDSGFRLKSQRGRSGDVHDIIFRNCTMTGVKNPVYIECWYDKSTKPVPSEAEAEPVTSTTPAFRDILIQNVVSTGTPYNTSAKAYFPVYIYGLPESYVKNVTFDNVQIEAQKGMFLAYCNVNFINGCKITNSKTPGKLIETSYEADIEGDYTGSGYVPGEGDPVTYMLDASTATCESGATEWTFSNGCSIISESGDRGYAAAKNNTIKFSRNYVFTINLPANVSVSKVAFTGYCNKNDKTSYLKSLNGVTYDEADYVFPALNATPNTATYSIDLDNPAVGSLSFEFSGDDQTAASIVLHGNVATTITDVMADKKGNGKIYNIQGMAVKNADKSGLYICNGKKFIVK